MAKAVGADYTVLVKSRDSQEVARQIEEVMGQKPEITIECSGAPPSIQTAIYVSCSICLKVLIKKYRVCYQNYNE